jgi:hypothetical protein
MPGLSENDPAPGEGRAGPPLALVIIVVVVVVILVALHLSGLVGGSS